MELALSIFGLSLVLLTLGMVFTRSFFYLTLLMSASSIVICICYLLMDAPDVAMTEAALGACLSTAVLLSLAQKVRDDVYSLPSIRVAFALLICLCVGACLLYAGMDMPEYGNMSVPAQLHINQYFLEHTKNEIGTKSFVAAILASYRGYDTLGETTVILIAALGVLLILRNDDAK